MQRMYVFFEKFHSILNVKRSLQTDRYAPFFPPLPARMQFLVADR